MRSQNKFVFFIFWEVYVIIGRCELSSIREKQNKFLENTIKVFLSLTKLVLEKYIYYVYCNE